MRTPAIHLSRCIKDEDGGVLAFIAVSLPVFLLLLAFVIDLDMARLTGNRLQITADSAALAGASQLPDDDDVASVASNYARKNYADVAGHPVLHALDISTGHWEDGSYEAGALPKNAVRVVTRRNDANSNPLASIFARAAGIENFQLSRTAIAIADPALNCQNGGFFSDDEVFSGSNNDYVSDFCLYGKNGVKIGSDNSFEAGTEIGMNDTGDFEQSGNNTGVDDALKETEKTLVLPDMVPGIISDMRQSSLTNMPAFITNGPVELDEINDSTPLLPNTLYIVEEVADFGSDRSLSNIAVVAKKEVKIGSNVNLTNVVFATPDKILLGSDNELGDGSYCDDSSYNIYLMSGNNVEFGSNNNLRGVQIGADGELKLGSDIGVLYGVYAEATEKIDYGSSDGFGSCPGGLTSHFGSIISETEAARLMLVQ